jgi:hypothetical protein
MLAAAAAQTGSALLRGAKITGRSLRQEEFVELRVASGMWFRISSIEGKKLTRRARQFSSLSWAQAFSSRWLAQACCAPWHAGAPQASSWRIPLCSLTIRTIEALPNLNGLTRESGLTESRRHDLCHDR